MQFSWDPEQGGKFSKPIDFDKEVDTICNRISSLLKQKNKSYGNAALDPVRVFSKASPEEQLLVRIDDKLSRLKRGHEYQNEDTISDLIGYLILLLIARKR